MTSPHTNAILDAISLGHTTTAAIARFLNLSDRRSREILAELERQGVVARTKVGDRAVWRAADILQGRPWRPYVRPPAPPRRPGSDHSHIPSMAGGQKIGSL